MKCPKCQFDKREEAYRLLIEIYNWFAEGFDTLDLKEAKALVDGVPGNVKEGISKEEADGIKGQLEEAGAGVEIEDCEAHFINCTIAYNLDLSPWHPASVFLDGGEAYLVYGFER